MGRVGVGDGWVSAVGVEGSMGEVQGDVEESLGGPPQSPTTGFKAISGGVVSFKSWWFAGVGLPMSNAGVGS